MGAAERADDLNLIFTNQGIEKEQKHFTILGNQFELVL